MKPEHFPLSDIQQAYFIGRQGIYEFGAVGIHFYFEIGGDFEYDRLNEAWSATINHHPMLRAHAIDETSQIILDDCHYDIEQVDLSDLTQGELELKLHELRNALSHTVYDPTKWPLFKLVLCQLKEKNLLLISIDAINIDLNSFIIIFNNFAASYNNSPLSRKPEYTYREYVLSLESQKSEADYINCQEFWQKKLEALSPPPKLPERINTSQLGDYKFQRLTQRFPAEKWSAAKKKFSTDHEITPSCLLLSAYAETVREWSENRDFTLNVTAFNRQSFHEDAIHIEGDFTSMLFVEAKDIDGNFIDRAKAIQDEIWDCLEHRYGAGPEALRAYRASNESIGNKALYPIVFTSAISLELDQSGLYGALGKLGTVSFALTQTPQLSIDYQVHEIDGDLYIIWDYISDLYPEGMVENMFRCYTDLLNEILQETVSVDDIAAVPLSSDDQALLSRFNETDAPYSKNGLDEFFVEACRRNPDKIAIYTEDSDITYGELLSQSRRIASLLKDNNVSPEEPVGIYMDKSIDQIAAVFGILLAGACYVPLDPASVDWKLRAVISDAGLKTVLTDNPELELSPEYMAKFIDIEWAKNFEEFNWTSRGSDASTSLAYILYTSGSTGAPKGVAIEHRSVVNRMSEVVERYRIDGSDVAFGLTALHHDLSVFDLFGMLCFAQGSVALPSEQNRRNPETWSLLIDRANVTTWNSVPAFAGMLCDYTKLEKRYLLSSLRLFVLSGDFIPVTLPDRLRQLIFELQIISSGGPTETTVWDVTYKIDEVDPNWRSIPYGVPLRNARYYVLDDQLRQKPIWAIGEFYIAGEGLARCYWNNANLTNEKFITHPETSERLFKSGDLGYVDASGQMIIVGRKDHQVKINGERIELGEIENIIENHPEVERCIVVLDECKTNNRKLVAFIKWSEDNTSHDSFYAIPNIQNSTSADKVEFKLKNLAPRTFDNDSRRIELKTATDYLARCSLTARSSIRTFQSASITKEQLGHILSPLVPYKLTEPAFPKFSYPSAGGLYPTRAYVQILRSDCDELLPGYYYFEPFTCELYMLNGDMELNLSEHTEDNTQIVSNSSFLLHLVGSYDAIEPTYGALSRDFCLLEAGYMGQILMEEAGRFDVGLCPLGAFDKLSTAQALQLTEKEEILHSFAGGLLPTDVSASSSSVTSGKMYDIESYATTNLQNSAVPSRFIELREWPLNKNGKVDRSELTKLTGQVMEPSVKERGGDNSLTGILCEVFESEMGMTEVQPDISFKDYGANSVTLIRLHRAINERLNIELPVRTILEVNTINQLITKISELGR